MQKAEHKRSKESLETKSTLNLSANEFVPNVLHTPVEKDQSENFSGFKEAEKQSSATQLDSCSHDTVKASDETSLAADTCIVEGEEKVSDEPKSMLQKAQERFDKKRVVYMEKRKEAKRIAEESEKIDPDDKRIYVKRLPVRTVKQKLQKAEKTPKLKKESEKPSKINRKELSAQKPSAKFQEGDKTPKLKIDLEKPSKMRIIFNSTPMEFDEVSKIKEAESKGYEASFDTKQLHKQISEEEGGPSCASSNIIESPKRSMLNPNAKSFTPMDIIFSGPAPVYVKESNIKEAYLCLKGCEASLEAKELYGQNYEEELDGPSNTSPNIILASIPNPDNEPFPLMDIPFSGPAPVYVEESNMKEAESKGYEASFEAKELYGQNYEEELDGPSNTSPNIILASIPNPDEEPFPPRKEAKLIDGESEKIDPTDKKINRKEFSAQKPPAKLQRDEKTPKSKKDLEKPSKINRMELSPRKLPAKVQKDEKTPKPKDVSAKPSTMRIIFDSTPMECDEISNIKEAKSKGYEASFDTKQLHKQISEEEEGGPSFASSNIIDASMRSTLNPNAKSFTPMRIIFDSTPMESDEVSNIKEAESKGYEASLDTKQLHKQISEEEAGGPSFASSNIIDAPKHSTLNPNAKSFTPMMRSKEWKENQKGSSNKQVESKGYEAFFEAKKLHKQKSKEEEDAGPSCAPSNTDIPICSTMNPNVKSFTPINEKTLSDGEPAEKLRKMDDTATKSNVECQTENRADNKQRKRRRRRRRRRNANNSPQYEAESDQLRTIPELEEDEENPFCSQEYSEHTGCMIGGNIINIAVNAQTPSMCNIDPQSIINQGLNFLQKMSGKSEKKSTSTNKLQDQIYKKKLSVQKPGEKSWKKTGTALKVDKECQADFVPDNEQIQKDQVWKISDDKEDKKQSYSAQGDSQCNSKHHTSVKDFDRKTKTPKISDLYPCGIEADDEFGKLHNLKEKAETPDYHIKHHDQINEKKASGLKPNEELQEEKDTASKVEEECYDDNEQMEIEQYVAEEPDEKVKLQKEAIVRREKTRLLVEQKWKEFHKQHPLERKQIERKQNETAPKAVEDFTYREAWEASQAQQHHKKGQIEREQLRKREDEKPGSSAPQKYKLCRRASVKDVDGTAIGADTCTIGSYDILSDDFVLQQRESEEILKKEARAAQYKMELMAQMEEREQKRLSDETAPEAAEGLTFRHATEGSQAKRFCEEGQVQISLYGVYEEDEKIKAQKAAIAKRQKKLLLAEKAWKDFHEKDRLENKKELWYAKEQWRKSPDRKESQKQFSSTPPDVPYSKCRRACVKDSDGVSLVADACTVGRYGMMGDDALLQQQKKKQADREKYQMDLLKQMEEKQRLKEAEESAEKLRREIETARERESYSSYKQAQRAYQAKQHRESEQGMSYKQEQRRSPDLEEDEQQFSSTPLDIPYSKCRRACVKDSDGASLLADACTVGPYGLMSDDALLQQQKKKRAKGTQYHMELMKQMEENKRLKKAEDSAEKLQKKRETAPRVECYSSYEQEERVYRAKRRREYEQEMKYQQEQQRKSPDLEEDEKQFSSTPPDIPYSPCRRACVKDSGGASLVADACTVGRYGIMSDDALSQQQKLKREKDVKYQIDLRKQMEENKRLKKTEESAEKLGKRSETAPRIESSSSYEQTERAYQEAKHHREYEQEQWRKRPDFKIDEKQFSSTPPDIPYSTCRRACVKDSDGTSLVAEACTAGRYGIMSDEAYLQQQKMKRMKDEKYGKELREQIEKKKHSKSAEESAEKFRKKAETSPKAEKYSSVEPVQEPCQAKRHREYEQAYKDQLQGIPYPKKEERASAGMQEDTQVSKYHHARRVKSSDDIALGPDTCSIGLYGIMSDDLQLRQQQRARAKKEKYRMEILDQIEGKDAERAEKGKFQK